MNPAPMAEPCVERAWDGFAVAEGRGGAHDHHVPASREHRVFLVLSPGAGAMRRKSGDEIFEGVPGEGTLSIVPAGEGGRCKSEAGVHALHVRLSADFVSRIARESFGARRFRLATRLGVRDEPMRQIALLLRAEVHAPGEGSPLLAESLARALTIYLLRFHAHFHAQSERAVCAVCGGLSDPALDRVESLVRERLAEPITLDDMAQAVGASRFHFARSFKKSTGMTPHAFVVAHRVEHARQLILEGRLPLREIAHASGFADQSHMTRHFRRLLGDTPRALQVLARDESEQERSKIDL